MKALIELDHVNPGGRDPENDKLDAEIRELWHAIKPFLNFYIWLSVIVAAVIMALPVINNFFRN